MFTNELMQNYFSNAFDVTCLLPTCLVIIQKTPRVTLFEYFMCLQQESIKTGLSFCMNFKVTSIMYKNSY